MEMQCQQGGKNAVEIGRGSSTYTSPSANLSRIKTDDMSMTVMARAPPQVMLWAMELMMARRVVLAGLACLCSLLAAYFGLITVVPDPTAYFAVFIIQLFAVAFSFLLIWLADVYALDALWLHSLPNYIFLLNLFALLCCLQRGWQGIHIYLMSKH
jgi:hypothetical protein